MHGFNHIGIISTCALHAMAGFLSLGGEAEQPKTAGGTTEFKATENEFRASLAHYCQALAKTPDAAPVPVQLGGWAALQVPACAVAGLVLLGEGSTPVKGPYAAQLNKLYKYTLVATQGFPVGGASHETWPLAFGILFLSEVHRVQPSAELRAHIGKLVARLEAGQEGVKGWRHALQPEKGEKYGPLMAPSLWCTAALASAKERGVAVDETRLQTAFSMLRQSVGRFGGAHYYSYQQALVTPGRSGAVLWILKRYTDTPGAEAERAQAFLLRHVALAHNGHASQAMNLGWAALGAAAAGPEANAAYWKVQLPILLAARQDNGSFPPQPWRDLGIPDTLGDVKPRYGRGDGPEEKQEFWPDRMYGEGWTAAWMLLAWQCGLGRGVLATKPAVPTTVAAAPDDGKEKQRLELQAAFAEAAGLLEQGKFEEAGKKLDAQLAAHAGHAELYRLRGLAALPALAQLPGPLDLKALADGRDGWGASAESRALSYLDRALRAKEGKGLVPEAFDASVQLLMARICAKRLVVVAGPNPRSPAWVPLYNDFVRVLKAPLQNPATQAQALAVMQAVTAHLPQKSAPPGKQ